ncbi:MAG: hypothetical protein IKZ19_08380, partial [Clostridia bacterium]|nr:hypothetical protein [Clostridia bacterium]
MEQNFEPETILTDAPVDAPEEENSPSEPNCTSPSEPGITPPAAPRFTPKQKTAAILSLAAGFFAVKLAIGNSSPLGAAIYTALAFILTAVFIFSEGRPIRVKDAVIPTAAVVLSAGCVLTSVPALRALIVLTEIPLYVYWVYCALSGSQESFPGKYAFFELLKGAFVTPIPSMGILWPAMFTKTGGKNKNTLWWILLGIVIALFPTAVIISLLSYDQAFTDLLGKLTAR